MNLIAPVLAGASFISGLNQQKDAKKKGDKAAKSQEAITKEQLAYWRDYIKGYGAAGSDAGKPLAGGIGDVAGKALQVGQNYDPEAELRAAEAQYKRSQASDFNSVRLPVGLRGLKDSSEDATGVSAVAARRAFDMSKLRLEQPGRTLSVLGQSAGIGMPAFQALNPAAISQGTQGTLAGAAQTYGNMANQNYGQAAGINPFKALQGLNWDWLKMK